MTEDPDLQDLIDDFARWCKVVDPLPDLQPMFVPWTDHDGTKRSCWFTPDPQDPKHTYLVTGDNPQPIFDAMLSRFPKDMVISPMDIGIITGSGISYFYVGNSTPCAEKL